MTLPSQTVITYTLDSLPEFKEKIKFKPMRVSDHKALHAATDLGDDSSLSDVISQIVSSCTNNKVLYSVYPQYIIDYVFMQIYIKSVTDKTYAEYTCSGYKRITTKDSFGVERLTDEYEKNEAGDNIICGNTIKMIIPLEKAKILYPENFENNKVVKIDDNITIKFKVMPLDQFNEIAELEEQSIGVEDNQVRKDLIEKVQKLMVFYSIDYIDNSGDVLKPDVDFTSDELSEWIDNLDGSVIGKIDKFFEKVPYLAHTMNTHCSNCGSKNEIELRGLKGFFL